MKQAFQDPKAGTIQVVDIAQPSLRPGTILVRNAFSVVSPGTERGTVSAARDSYIKTARARPDLVRRVLDTVKREGVLAAYRKVRAKLSEPQGLGYSSAGTDDHLRLGDRVACCGPNVASHAEVIRVPTNLAARIPDGVSLEDAAFATLGAIALHRVRLAEPQLGGRVAAFDLAPDLVERAKSLGAEVGLAGGTDDQVQAALAWNEGLVPFGLPREIAHAKELELRISRSYGPGRYDVGFEEKGLGFRMEAWGRSSRRPRGIPSWARRGSRLPRAELRWCWTTSGRSRSSAAASERRARRGGRGTPKRSLRSSRQ